MTLVDAGNPSEVAELKRPCEEEGTYDAEQRWETVIARGH